MTVKGSFAIALVLLIVAAYMLGAGLNTYTKWDNPELETVTQQQVVLLKAIAQMVAAVAFVAISLPFWFDVFKDYRL